VNNTIKYEKMTNPFQSSRAKNSEQTFIKRLWSWNKFRTADNGTAAVRCLSLLVEWNDSSFVRRFDVLRCVGAADLQMSDVSLSIRQFVECHDGLDRQRTLKLA
jgi:hypothetical protein